MSTRWPDPRPEATFHFGEGRVAVHCAGPETNRQCAVILEPLSKANPVGEEIPPGSSVFTPGVEIHEYPKACSILDFSGDSDGLGALVLIEAIVAVCPSVKQHLRRALRQV